MALACALRKKGAFVRDNWLQGVENFIQCQGNSVNVSSVWEQFLYSDMRVSAVACLDNQISDCHDFVISGPYVLQVNQILNIGTCHKKREEETSSRLLKFAITDGHQLIFGFEYNRLPNIQILSQPGIKICIHNVPVRRGLLMLGPNNVDILGGMVKCLEEEVNKKKSPRTHRGTFGTSVPSPPLKKGGYPSVKVTKPQISQEIRKGPIKPGNSVSSYFHKSASSQSFRE